MAWPGPPNGAGFLCLPPSPPPRAVSLLLLPLLLLGPLCQDPAPNLAERLAKVHALLEAQDNGNDLGAALHAVANLRSAEAVSALADLVPTLNGLGRAAAIQALGMCDHPDGVAALRRLATSSKQMPDRALAVRILAGEADVEWLLEFFQKEKNGLVRGAVLRELLRAKVPGLEETVLDAAKDKSADVRCAGLEGIAELVLLDGGKIATKALKDSSLAARIAACRAAALTGGPAAFKVMVAELRKTKNEDFRDALTQALQLATQPKEIETILNALGREKDEELIARLMSGLASAAVHDPEASAKVLVKMVGHPSPFVREQAIRGLAATRPPGALALLAGLLEHEDPVTRADAAWALAELGELSPEAEARLLPLLFDTSISVRVNATKALAGARSEQAGEAVARMLSDEFWSVRSCAVESLLRHRRAAALGPLIAQMEQDDSRVRDEIAEALGALTGLSFGDNAMSWRHWFDELEAGYELPALEVALRQLADAEAARRANSRETTTRYHGIAIPRGGVVFVLDVSGSMNELMEGESTQSVTRYQHFSEALKDTISNLPGGARFDIITFSTRPRLWRPRLVTADRENIDDAKRFLDSNSAFGGTNIYDSLAAALAIKNAQTIYLLTDGDPTVGVTHPYTIIQRIARLNRDLGAAIHTIAAGEVSGEFLAELAAANGGRSVDLR